MFRLELGQKVRDRISGFKGVVMARVEYITGCHQYAICPQKVEKDGGLPVWDYLDDDRLAKAPGKITLEKKPTGGPQQTPARR